MTTDNAFSGLPAPWIVLASLTFGDGPERTVVDYLVLHPERGALLVDFGSKPKPIDPLAAFVDFLRVEHFHVTYPERLPVFRWMVAPDESVPSTPEALAPVLLKIMSKDGQPVLTRGEWAEALAALLTPAAYLETDAEAEAFSEPVSFAPRSFAKETETETEEVPSFRALAPVVRRRPNLDMVAVPEPATLPRQGRHKPRATLLVAAGLALLFSGFAARPLIEVPISLPAPAPAPVSLPRPEAVAPAAIPANAPAAAPAPTAAPAPAPAPTMAEVKPAPPRPLVRHRHHARHIHAARPPRDAAELPPAAETCRVYSGQAQAGGGQAVTGLACRLADGSWQSIMESPQ